MEKKITRRKTKPTIDSTSSQGSCDSDSRLDEGDDFDPKGVFRFKSHEEADTWMLKWAAWRKRKEGTSKEKNSII